MNQPKVKFVVRKYIYARSAQEAIRLDKKTPVSDVWVDLDQPAQEKIGFNNEVNKKVKK